MEKQAVLEKNLSVKIQILKSVFSEYRKACSYISEPLYSYQSPLFIKEKKEQYGQYEHQLLWKISQMNHYKEYVAYIDHQLLYLNHTEQLIIRREFIEDAPKRWWESYFSSATYYRHRKKAVERLITLLFS